MKAQSGVTLQARHNAGMNRSVRPRWDRYRADRFHVPFYRSAMPVQFPRLYSQILHELPGC